MTAQDYATYRAGFPDSLFERLAIRGIGLPGQAVVDLGTGTGTLARGFAKRECHVYGIDKATRLMQEAKQLDQVAGVKVDYRIATAEKTGLPNRSCDVVTAGQSWHWFERAAAAGEAARILRPHGFLVIAHFDWIPLSGNVVEATEALIMAHNPAWNMGGGNGLYPLWLRDVAEAGFRAIETFSYDMMVPYSHEAWRGRIRASAGVGASLLAEQVLAFDKELAVLLDKRFPEPVLQVHHRIFALCCRVPHFS